jgi:outer membrane protein TolC
LIAAVSASPRVKIDPKVVATRLQSAPADPPPSGPPEPTDAYPPTTSTEVPPVSIPAAAREYPIDLSGALRLAEVENPTIAEARVAISITLAQLMAARVLLVPSLNGGTNYNGHGGDLQRSSGRILDVYKQSLYVGSGAYTVGSNSISIPGVNIASPLTDAIFEPLAARHRLTGARHTARATANNTLRDVALAHFDLLAAEAVLEARRLNESQTALVAKVTRDFAESGQGRDADAKRAATEVLLRRAEIQRAEEEVMVTAARLSQLLNLDPSVRLRTISPEVVPIDLVDLHVPTAELIRAAITYRPEMGARNAAVRAADARLMQEYARPILPTIWVGFSGGSMGGGSNLTPPYLGNFKPRSDFDVALFWTFQNFGFGNLGLQKQRRGELGQADGERARILNLVREEVTSARAEAIAAQGQIDYMRRKLKTGEDGFEHDFERARQNLGRPIEVLNNLTYLVNARIELIRIITAYNKQQFRLFVALGSPPPLLTPAEADLTKAPVTSPIHSAELLKRQ